ncbi:MAG: hypothetical protein CO189_02565 [candidate division Zixibacteria bacterium CG_4_9_14_3_um_filter_46_8]|nr:MAG: hypothetical protein CO189_02565 [candidate division Zixibacteria bacterium CG_4_9_14_3_um_filter_46_8]
MISNARLKALIALKQKKNRQKEGKFLVEGDNLIASALENGFDPEEIFYSVDYGKNNIDSLIGNRPTKKVFISSPQMRKLSDVSTPPGIAALMPTFKYTLDDFATSSKLLYMDQVSDPGNAGTLIRNGCAFGFDAVIFGQGSCELYNPKLLRSTAGYIFQIKALENISYEKLSALKQQGFKLISGDSNARLSIEDQKCPEKAVLVLGNEPRGVSEEAKNLVDLALRIPLSSKVDSLNVAAAGAILMYWARNARLAR